MPSQPRSPSQEAAPGATPSRVEDLPALSPVEAVTERVFDSAVAAMDVAVAAIGDRLGYYAMLEEHPRTAPQLAAATHTNARYAREWLEHQALAGFLEMQPSKHPDEHVYSLAPGVAEVLAQHGTLETLAPLVRQVAAGAGQWARVADGARNGQGLAWADYGPDMRESQSDMNGPQLRQLLAREWLPQALPELHRRLADGEAVRVADVGTGGGWAAIGLAEAFSGVLVDGYDIDPATITMARGHVAAAGLGDRVRIVNRDLAADPPVAAYDLVMAFECLHDMPDPIEMLGGMLRMLRPGGRLLVADMAGADELELDGDPVQRALYGYSLLICMPDAMAGGAVHPTGTVFRPFTLNMYARRAGFSEVTEVPIEHDFWRFYLLRP